MFFDIEIGLIVLKGSIGPWQRYTLYWAPFYCNLYLTRQPHSYTTTDIKTNIEEEGVVGSVWARGPTPDLSQRVAQGHRLENQPNVHLKTNNVKLHNIKTSTARYPFLQVVPNCFKSLQWDEPPGRFRQFCNWHQAGGAAYFFIPTSMHTLTAVSCNKLYVLCLNFITSNIFLKGEHKNYCETVAASAQSDKKAAALETFL